MRQDSPPPKRTRRRHCKCCDELFDADPRVKERQKYCSKASCQLVRQRQNEAEWYRENPDIVADSKRKWQKRHPGYSRQRLVADPQLQTKNRQQTQERMQEMRWRSVFDKNKSILTQVIGGIKDKCCLIRGNWLFLRLTRTSRWAKATIVRHTGKRLRRVANQLPKSKPYDLSGMLRKDGGHG